jgi:hypothetical protein
MSEKSRIIVAPNEVPAEIKHLSSVFLSGSITKGGTDWRKSVTQELSGAPIVILNPYRKDWDKTWKEERGCEPYWTQVRWELDHMESASILAVFFAAGTDAPITLLELGLSATTNGKAIVCCPDGYSKKGNVQAVCEKYDIRLTENIQDFVTAIKDRLASL